MTQLVPLTLACKQSGGGEGRERKQSLQLRPWNLNSASNSTVAPRRLSCQIFVNRREVETSANVTKHWKHTWKHAPRVMPSLLMSSPSISISHRLFQCRYSNSRDVAASSPSFSRPAARAPRRVCSPINLFLFHFWTLSFLLTNIQFFNWLEASREIKSLSYTERTFTFGKGKMTIGNFCHLS